MNRKGFIFDLDGVIVDTAKYHYFAWSELAKKLDIPFSKEDNEHLKGVSRIGSLEKILKWGNKELDQDQFNTLLEEKNQKYLSYVNKMTKDEILPDVPRVLSFLKENDQSIALGSASKNAKTILSKVDLLGAFQTIVDGKSVSKAKPNPEVFLKAADSIGVVPKDCIVFEDSLAGIQAANTAGMTSIGIGDASVLSEAHYVFRNFTQISNEFLNKLISES